jgi:molybdopterin-guanine dinucleotide biosynthesis protein A
MADGGVTGAILAGGASTRMGTDKATLCLPDGRAMIEVVADALGCVCSTLVVSGTASALERLEHIPDLRPGCGPLGGVEAVLASGRADRYLFCPCDMPRLRSDMLGPLAEADGRAVVLRFEQSEWFLPLPVVLSVDVLPTVQAALDDGLRAVHRVLTRLEPIVVEVPADWEAGLTSANTPEDLDA